MYLRLGFVLVVAAVCLGAARAEYEDAAEEVYRLARSIRQGSLPRPGKPQPSPTFPRPPVDRPRYAREVDFDDEPVARYVRSLQPYNPRFPSPVPLPGAPPRPFPTHHRFKRGGGSVAIDVNKNHGSKPTTKLTYEQNLYKSGNGRTRVDASGYATNRGDRGGMINFTHRFP